MRPSTLQLPLVLLPQLLPLHCRQGPIAAHVVGLHVSAAAQSVPAVLQAPTHVLSIPQRPAELHTWRVLCPPAVVHRTVVGAHSTHSPSRQAPGQAVVSVQAPAALQVWGVRPLHRRAPGVQATHAPFRQAPVQALPFIQVFPLPQVWGTLPLQRLAPAAHCRHAPLLLHLPPSQSDPSGDRTHWSATQPDRQGPEQLCVVHMGMAAAQRPASMHSGVAIGQASVRVWQLPSAAHTRRDRLLPMQVAAPQAVPTASRRQPPWPLQPFSHASFWQDPAGSAPPVGTLEQVPSRPGRAQDMHDRLHAPLQQRPCAQVPLAHWPPELHVLPSGRLPQSPLVQTFPDEHWLSLAQLLAQRLPLQPRWGAQLRSADAWQLPPRQMPAGVSVLAAASQRGCWQTDPSVYFRQAPSPSHNPSVPHEAMP